MLYVLLSVAVAISFDELRLRRRSGLGSGQRSMKCAKRLDSGINERDCFEGRNGVALGKAKSACLANSKCGGLEKHLLSQTGPNLYCLCKGTGSKIGKFFNTYLPKLASANDEPSGCSAASSCKSCMPTDTTECAWKSDGTCVDSKSVPMTAKMADFTWTKEECAPECSEATNCMACMPKDDTMCAWKTDGTCVDSQTIPMKATLADYKFTKKECGPSPTANLITGALQNKGVYNKSAGKYCTRRLKGPGKSFDTKKEAKEACDAKMTLCKGFYQSQCTGKYKLCKGKLKTPKKYKQSCAYMK